MPQNANDFMMPTHPLQIGAFSGERHEFDLAAEKAYEVLLDALHDPMTAYALARVPDHLVGDERDDCVAQLQLRYVRMILAKVNMDNFVDF
jgi:hypothetical protein